MDKLVFREEGLTLEKSKHRYDHNERKLDRYNNDNIYKDLSQYNIYYKKIDDNKTYEDVFNEKLANKEISTRGLKKNADVLSEIIIAVNAKYWKNKTNDEIFNFFDTSYDYIKDKMGEENIISAVLHTDEIFTDTDGEEYVNYHMHIVSIPVTKKNIYFSKRSKEHAGELKEVINQVSHSKKFEGKKDDKHNLIAGYTIWQDELIAALNKAHILDITRGEVGSGSYHVPIAFLKKVMNDMENNNKDLIPELEVKEYDRKHALITYNSLKKLEKIKANVEKEKSAVDMSINKIDDDRYYIREQKKIAYDNKNKLEEYDRIKKENERLKEENQKIQKQLSLLEYIISVIYNIIITIINLITDPEENNEKIKKNIYNIKDTIENMDKNNEYNKER